MVGEHQYEAISELTQAVRNVALGATRNLSIVQNDGRTITRSRMFSVEEDPAGLMDVADALYRQSKIVRHLAVAWEGNAHGEARSYMEH